MNQKSQAFLANVTRLYQLSHPVNLELRLGVKVTEVLKVRITFLRLMKVNTYNIWRASNRLLTQLNLTQLNRDNREGGKLGCYWAKVHSNKFSQLEMQSSLQTIL